MSDDKEIITPEPENQLPANVQEIVTSAIQEGVARGIAEGLKMGLSTIAEKLDKIDDLSKSLDGVTAEMRKTRKGGESAWDEHEQNHQEVVGGTSLVDKDEERRRGERQGGIY